MYGRSVTQKPCKLCLIECLSNSELFRQCLSRPGRQASKYTQEPDAGTTVTSLICPDGAFSSGISETVCAINIVKVSVSCGLKNGKTVKSITAKDPLGSQDPYGGGVHSCL